MWSDQELNTIMRKLVVQTGLGSKGDIAKILLSINAKLDNFKTSNTGNNSSSANQSPSSTDKSTIDDHSAVLKDITDQLSGTTDFFSETLTESTKGVSSTFGSLIKTSLIPTISHTTNFGQSLISATTSTKAFNTIVAAFVGRGVLSSFASAMEQNTDTLRTTYAVGQTFSGSILELQKSAANAALPIDDFAKIIIDNSANMASLGGPTGLIGLQNAVRTNIVQFGAYGLQIDEVNNLLSDYLSTLTVYGPMDNHMRNQAATSFKTLVAETTALSTLTGRNRKDMLKQINDASKEASFQASLIGIPAAQSQLITESLTKVNSVFSAFGENSGAFFTQIMSKSASGISAAYSEFGRTLNESGMSNVIADFDALGAKVRNHTATQDDATKVISHFMQSVENNRENLQAQMANDNQGAAKTLEMYADLQRQLGSSQGIDKFLKSLEKAADTQSKSEQAMAPFTKLMMNFSEIMSRIGSAFSSAFFGKMGTNLDKLADSLTPAPDTINGFIVLAEVAGKTLGGIVDALAGVGKVISYVSNILTSFSNAVGGAVASLTGLGDGKAIGDALKAGMIAAWVAAILYFKTKVVSSLIGAVKDMVVRMVMPNKISTGAMIDPFTTTGVSTTARGSAIAASGGVFGETATQKGGKLIGIAKGFAGGAAKMLKGGLFSIIGEIGSMAVDLLMPNGATGKETIKSMLSWGGGLASIGAMLGGPYGAAIGAALGAGIGIISTNFDGITDTLSKWMGDFSSTITKFTDYITNGETWNSVLTGIYSFTIEPFVSGIKSVKDGIVGIFTSITNVFSDLFAWIGNLDISGTVRSALMDIPMPDMIRKQIMAGYDSPASTKTSLVPSPPSPTLTPTNNIISKPQEFQNVATVDNASTAPPDYTIMFSEMTKILAEVNRNIVGLRDFV